MDVTVDAQKIISCVARMKERFGVATIVDVLRGSKNEKVLRLGLNRLSTYGISDKSGTQLRDIINHLILTNSLIKTDDQYPVIKLGPDAPEILRGGKVVNMKLGKEDPSAQAPIKKASKKKEKAEQDRKRAHKFFPGKDNLSAEGIFQKEEAPSKTEQPATKTIDKILFDKLKELRLTIAAEQKVPAFIILHDSSLVDMCIKLPKNLDSFMKVSGIGKVKAEKFGERFLRVIADYVGGNRP